MPAAHSPRIENRAYFRVGAWSLPFSPASGAPVRAGARLLRQDGRLITASLAPYFPLVTRRHAPRVDGIVAAELGARLIAAADANRNCSEWLQFTSNAAKGLHARAMRVVTAQHWTVRPWRSHRSSCRRTSAIGPRRRLVHSAAPSSIACRRLYASG